MYRDLLGVDVLTVNDTDEPVRIAFLELPSNQVHLISREARGSDIDELLDDLLAVSPYHVAYTVSDIHAAVECFEDAGLEMYTPEPERGLGPYLRAFADPKAIPGVPFEFVELVDTTDS